MLAPEFTLRDDFPPISYEAWRSLAEADLEGAPFEQKLVTHTYEGIDIQPVYTRADWPSEKDPEGFPGLAPFVRGARPLGAVQTGWDLRQEHAHPDPAITNQAILEDLQGGVTSLLLRLDIAARNGLDPDDPAADALAGRDGLMVYHADDLDLALANVHLDMIGVTLEAGAAFVPAAAMLAALWRRRGVALEQARGAFNADPLAVLVRDGHLPISPAAALTLMAELAAWTAKNYPQATAVRVGTAPYHHAGATAAQDLAFGMATAVEYLRAMCGAGLDIDTAARQILFSISLGTHHFLAIAKLRAARRLWARVVEACGGSPSAAAMRIHSRVSKRVLTLRDPYVNVLRNTVACFAAGVGGAEAITSVPFDAAVGLPDELSRRIARNTVLILQEEAHLNRVIDPPGGSWYLGWLTDQIADKAWGIFQDIERGGGMLRAIQDGWVARQIDSAFAPRAKNLARRKEGITGVSEFPNVAEQLVVRPAPDRITLRADAVARVAKARHRSMILGHLLTINSRPTGSTVALAVEAALAGASIGQLARALDFHTEPTAIPPLAPHPFAQPFEELRAASDSWQMFHGKRPRVFLANMGSVAHHTARATYAKNFFEAGGFEIIGNNGFREVQGAARAFTESGASIAVICSSDKLYPEIVPQLAPALKAAGARTVVLAGNPAANENAWREAGVDRFIFMKCDVLGILRQMLCEEGVSEHA
ncbi:MAG TPA: methylmalonyl-CoA mutase family protein [Gemmataceae bacterium]|nr:methylmalonyl-CoA mutase family protein [Gemmataceae bacterium]